MEQTVVASIFRIENAGKIQINPKKNIFLFLRTVDVSKKTFYILKTIFAPSDRLCFFVYIVRPFFRSDDVL